MLSTRTQKAREMRSRQSNLMSDIENMDVMLGNYLRKELDSNLEDEVPRWTLSPTDLGWT